MKAVIGVLCCLIAVSCHKTAKDDKPRGGRGGSPAPVRVTTIKAEVTPRVVMSSAMLEGERQADIYPKFTGKVAELLVKEGDPVKKGQLLFRIDRSDPGESFLSAPVEAPFSGWVGRFFVSMGQQVSQASPVVTIVDDSSLKAEVMLPIQDWQVVDKNTEVKVNVAGMERLAKVATIARSADPTLGRGHVTLDIQNSARDWRAGTLADVTFFLEPKSRVLLTTAALLVTDQGSFVYKLEGTKAKRVKVTYSLFNHDQAELLSGVQGGDVVVTVGGNQVSDGADVKIVD